MLMRRLITWYILVSSPWGVNHEPSGRRGYGGATSEADQIRSVIEGMSHFEHGRRGKRVRYEVGSIAGAVLALSIEM